MNNNNLHLLIKLLDKLETIEVNETDKNRRESINEDEKKKLDRKFILSLIFLVSAIIISIVFLIIILTTDLFNSEVYITLIIVLGSGLIGSSTSALVSLLDRYAKGYEAANGDKFPKKVPADKFSSRMNPFFLCRPILGISTAFLIYLAIESGVVKLNKTNEALILFCAIGSFFAKTLIERIRVTVKSISF